MICQISSGYVSTDVMIKELLYSGPLSEWDIIVKVDFDVLNILWAIWPFRFVNEIGYLRSQEKRIKIWTDFRRL